MGNFNIQKQNGGLQKQAPSAFMKSGLVLGGVAASGLALGVVSDELSRVEDAEAIGIDSTYDTTNDVLAWYHIKEFFRLNPDGKLRVMLVAQGTTLAQMVDKANPYAKKMIDDTNGELRRIGVVLNPASGYSSTLTGGFDADVLAAITAGQLLATEAFDNKRPCKILVEGREFNGTVAAMNDLRANECPDVFVTAIQDPAAVTAFALHAKSAAVGATLGMMSFVNENESIGWTAKGNLTSNLTGEFASVAISSGALAQTLEADFPTLTLKGLIFGRNYPSQAGVYFDDYPSCDLVTSDYAYGQEVSVINEAARRIYDQLFPRINGPIKIDPATGQVEPETAKDIETDGGQALDIMVRSEFISGYDVYFDPTQDIQATGIAEVQFSIVSIATGRTITAKIGFTKSI